VGYRDDTEAARLRAEALERELAERRAQPDARATRRMHRWLAWGNAAILVAATLGFAFGAWLALWGAR